MKTNFLFLAFLLFSVVVSAKSGEDKPYMTKTFGAAGIKALNVRTSGGHISVTGQSGEARVEVYIHTNNWNGSTADKEEIEDRLQDYTLTIKQDGETLVCEAKRKNEEKWYEGWKNSLSISFKIFVPENITTDLKTSGGSLNLKNLTGNQNFMTSGGSIRIQDLNGNIKGRTSGGSIKSDDCSGDIKISTSGGSITLNNTKGSIDANTSGGGIHVDNCTGNLSVSTSGGSITLNGIGGSVKASTSGGSISANILTAGLPVSLSTSAGSIHATMPLDKGLNLDLHGSRVNIGTLNNFSGKLEKSRVQGALNGGGALVSMHTSAGSVSIN